MVLGPLKVDVAVDGVTVEKFRRAMERAEFKVGEFAEQTKDRTMTIYEYRLVDTDEDGEISVIQNTGEIVAKDEDDARLKIGATLGERALVEGRKVILRPFRAARPC